MNEMQLELTKLIGKKELTFGCITKDERGMLVCTGNENFAEISKLERRRHIFSAIGIDEEDTEIIGHPATLSDLHRGMNERGWIWEQRDCDIKIFDDINWLISYNSSFDLLDQSTETLKQLISIIKSNQ